MKKDLYATRISDHASATANGTQLHLMRHHGVTEEEAMSLDPKLAAWRHGPPHDHMIPRRRWAVALKMVEA